MKIKTKKGNLEPLIFNRAQQYIHERIEAQKAKTGKVRVIIIKGRQMGASTYVEARCFHNTTHKMNRKCFILTHEDEATQNLFNMVSLFDRYLPEGMQISKGAANAKELYFDKLESGYKVGTAGNKEVGRSSTIHFLHGSEVAFWPNAAQIVAGLMQAIPDIPGTEIILESTANGVGGYFHERYQEASSPDDEYEVIFVPWFWMPEYVADVPDGFARTPEEDELASLYGLTDERLAWRRKKIREFVGADKEAKFKQEYPCIIGSSRVSTQRGFITLDKVRKGDILPEGVVIDAISKGVKPTMLLTTKDGYQIQGTPEHPVRLEDGSFCELQKCMGKAVMFSPLTFADRYIQCDIKLVKCVKSSIVIDDDWGRFIGLFMGDGSLHNATLSIVCDAKDVSTIDWVANFMRDKIGEPQIRKVGKGGIEIRKSSIWFADILVQLGLCKLSKNGHYKRSVHIPNVIWQSPESVCRQFLSGLFDADGFVAKKCSNIKFFAKGVKFTKDVQLMLLAFGIRSKTVSIEKKTSSGKVYTGNELVLPATEARKFADTIGFIADRKIQRSKERPTSPWSTDRKYEGNIVSSITDSGEEEVFDLTVPLTSTFNANGIVVHNCTPEEAFTTSTKDSLISIETVKRATQTKVPDSKAQVVFGVDPASDGGDRFVIFGRQARKGWLEYAHVGKLEDKDTMDAVGRIVRAYNAKKAEGLDCKVNIETDGMGIVFYDALKQVMPIEDLRKVTVGSRDQVLDKERYYFKKDECFGGLREWLLDTPCELPDNAELVQDLIAYKEGSSSNGALRLESKKALKQRGLRSPDIADALSLTFAFPVVLNTYTGPLYEQVSFV